MKLLSATAGTLWPTIAVASTHIDSRRHNNRDADNEMTHLAMVPAVDMR